MERVILSYSDQQVMTGLAILVAGYSQLARGSISTYHWQIMIFTAWFSSLAHITTLTVLRGYFRTRNPKARVVRVILMLFTIVLLIGALVPTQKSDWLELPSEPAQCYYQYLNRYDEYDESWLNQLNQYDDYLFVQPDYPSTIANRASFWTSVVVLVVSYLTRTIKLFSKSSDTVKYWVRTKPAERLKSTITDTDRRGRGWRISSFFLLVQLIILHGLTLVFTSIFWEVRIPISCLKGS